MPLVTRKTTTQRSRAVEPTEDDDEDERPARKPRNAEERIAARRSKEREPKFQQPESDDDGDEAEEERPARRARRDRDEDDAPRSSRKRASRDEDDDEDDRPASNAVQSGWGAAKKLKTEGGNFADEMSITNDEQLVKFLNDAPYAVYKQHWIEGLRSTKKRSFICMGRGCPLCAIGDSASKKWAFNVALFDGDEAEVKSLIAASRLFDLIADEHEGSDGPLDEGYWTLSKSGKKQSTTYKLKKIEGRKLEQNFGVTEDDLDEILEESDLVPYTAAQHQPPSKSYLQEIADEIVGDDD